MNAICTQRTAPRQNSSHRSPAKKRRASAGHVSLVETLMVVAIVLLLILGAVVTASGPQERASVVRTVRVESGQTLWSIARSNPVPGLTTQQTAELIAHTNGLTDNRIAAQSSLKVPVAPSGTLLAQR